MTERPFYVSAPAEAEVAHAIAWYEARRRGLGAAFFTEVRRAFVDIRQNPEAWPIWRASDPFRKRPLFRFPYVVFFTADAQATVIEAVAHGARRPGYWMER